MNKIRSVGISSLLLLGMPTIATANTNVDNFNDIYFGIGASFLTMDISGSLYDSNSTLIGSGSDDISGASMLGAFAGYQFNPWISVEGRGYFGLTDEDYFGTSVEMSRFFAVYGKPTLPLHEYFSLYGLFGYGLATAEVGGESDTEGDFTYGVGAEIGKGTNVKLQVEWVVIHDEDYSARLDNERLDYSIKVSGINANLAWYF
ncbi:outer membrane beta-barrel protein [Vibrio sp. EA2]|uniref:outer membrane beta-barrel protein n=1 Tax=Vibrio sp. EA2 TaxID=3079860 RepID=UPI0029496EA7|nr:outer membrane beta-barrel protein [Vibrio sp. EA2]MDV6249959.1 outer membrane beta-barrel protein [Vibrio sp. EA2]